MTLQKPPNREIKYTDDSCGSQVDISFETISLAEAPTQEVKRTISVKQSHLTESIGLSCDVTTATLVR